MGFKKWTAVPKYKRLPVARPKPSYQETDKFNWKGYCPNNVCKKTASYNNVRGQLKVSTVSDTTRPPIRCPDCNSVMNWVRNKKKIRDK